MILSSAARAKMSFTAATATIPTSSISATVLTQSMKITLIQLPTVSYSVRESLLRISPLQKTATIWFSLLVIRATASVL